MEENPPKRRKSDVNNLMCIICQEECSSKTFVLEPQSDSRDKLVASIRRRAGYGEEKMILCSNRLQALGLAEKTYRYHKECYKEITNKTKIERIKKSFEKFQGNSSNVKDEQNETVKQRPKVQDKRNMRSQGVVFNKDRCIFCQEQDGIIHKVAYLTTGAKMLDVAEKLQDIPLLLRLNNIPNASDAIANDVQYHRKCWVMAQRKSKVKESTPQELDDVNRVVADIEINNIVESLLKGSVDAVMDIKSLNTTYNDLLGTDDVNYKRYLKQLLLENVPGVTFVRPPARNESERICSSRSQSNSVEKTFQSSYDDYKSIFQAAKVIRKEIKAQERWQFNGSFDGFTVPKSLKLMLKWIIIGPTTIHASADEEIDRCVDVLSELVINMMKSDRQIQHSNKRNNNGYRKMNETPLTVGLGLHLYKSTRSKVLIEHMSNLGLCISYDKVLKIENAIANAVSAKMETSNGVYIPPNVVPGVPVHFAIDNCDFKNDTPDGKNEFHATAQVIIQKSISSNFPPLLLIDRCVEKFKENTIITEKISKPSILNETFPNFDGKISCIEQNDCNELDRTWALCQVMDEEISGVLPTWPAFNSLISLKPIVSTCQILPLYPSSPTDWSTLYTSLKIVQNINVEVTKNNKTIVSFDLQLYSKAMQLRSRPEIREGFVFRLGELHTVFAMLRVIGKYIEESGLDRIFVDSGMYGENTLKQILGGKHMKRSIEAHTTMYLALLRILLFDWYNESKDNKETMDNLKNQHAKQTSLVDMQDNVKLLKNIFKEHGILNKIFNFGDTLEHQGRFFRNYMRMFENLLLFIRASRDGLWMLHLSSMNDFAKYFFAHDQLNYARLTPMYLADMLQLEQSDNETWNYLKGNFSVGKSDIPFTSIGSDHAIEQENKNLKVNGGITGLTQTHSVLTRFCMVAPVLSSLSDEYRLKYDIQHPAKRKTHYQLTGSHLKRLSENVNKLKVEMEKYDVTFTRNNSVFNVVSKAVLPEEAATELLEHNSIGKKMYDEFITLRIQGGKQIWDKMAKRKLKTFKSHLAVIKKKVDGKVIQLREEKSLLSRFLLTSRKRPEIDLERCLGNFEFSIVPRSLFTSDGEPLACTDKSKVLHCIEELGSLHEDEDQPESNRIETSVLVIDSMAVLNQIHKDKDMETCKDLAAAFTSRVITMSSNYTEVRLVFDRYVRDSLKARTRRKRTSGKEIRYKISDSTKISSISLKSLLSHIDTKQDLTIYLAEKSKLAFNTAERKYVVTYDKCSESNIASFTDVIERHDHEEADTLLVLHCFDIAQRDPLTNCTVFSPDTDVFLLLIHFYPSLPQSLLFHTGKGKDVRKIDIGSCYEGLGINHARALLGFHVFTGCDQTGRFAKKSKQFWWKEFRKADENTLNALAQLGKDANVPIPDVLETLEKWVVIAYGGNKCPSTIKTIPELRWYMFAKFQSDVSTLPPTVAALKYKIYRSHYVALVLRKSLSSIQNLPSPLDFGWERSDDAYKPIMTDKLPAPVALIELSVCSCTTKCVNNRCKCRKNKLQCTDMCKCIDCDNDDTFEDSEDENEFTSDDDDD